MYCFFLSPKGCRRNHATAHAWFPAHKNIHPKECFLEKENNFKFTRSRIIQFFVEGRTEKEDSLFSRSEEKNILHFEQKHLHRKRDWFPIAFIVWWCSSWISLKESVDYCSWLIISHSKHTQQRSCENIIVLPICEKQPTGNVPGMTLCIFCIKMTSWVD